MVADFNFLNKIIGRRVMENAERAHSIAPEQFGSRKGKSSILHAINKQLTVDILRQEKRNFSLITLDAKGCYDRIVQPMASLALKRQGATDNMVEVMFSTIQKMERNVRTSYGDLLTTYKEENERFHGILQGNGAGPTIWTMLSSPMLDRLRDKGLGVKIRLATDNEINIPAFAFVDDVDLIQELQGEGDVTSPQLATDEWQDSLASSGGKLVNDKCKYSVVKHVWKNNVWEVDDKLDHNIKIYIPNDEDIPTLITQQPPSQGELALGIMFSPMGTTDDQVEYLKKRHRNGLKKFNMDI
jgi:Reverse transcriptase (RNA-dependent DNA polymerase)